MSFQQLFKSAPNGGRFQARTKAGRISTGMSHRSGSRRLAGLDAKLNVTLG